MEELPEDDDDSRVSLFALNRFSVRQYSVCFVALIPIAGFIFLSMSSHRAWLTGAVLAFAIMYDLMGRFEKRFRWQQRMLIYVSKFFFLLTIAVASIMVIAELLGWLL
jgi:hypothetical protein